MGIQAVNWNRLNDDYSLVFYNQMRSQLWFEEEIDVSTDKNTWGLLSEVQKDVYKKVLGKLTLLDTIQGGTGMVNLSNAIPDPQKKAVLNFMAMMEDVHAKSYSHIFTTLCTNPEIDEIFNWVEENKYTQKLAKTFKSLYRSVKTNRLLSMYMGAVTSVFLESLVFYSGFYYPLYLSSQGLLKKSGEIITLIVRDEAVHGAYVGRLAQDLYENMADNKKRVADDQVNNLLNLLLEIEDEFTETIYASVGLVDDVKAYVRYNANRALMNIGKDPQFEGIEVNPLVLAALDTSSKNHDFFSQKGNSYARALNVEELQDEDFIFD